MTEMEAALGRRQLAKLDQMNARRREAGHALRQALAAAPGVYPQETPADGQHVYSRFVMRVDPAVAGLDRDALQVALEGHGFALAPVYPVPIYRHDVFVKLAHGGLPKGLLTSYARVYAEEPLLRAYAELRLAGVESFCGQQLGFIVPDVIDNAHVEELGEAVRAIVSGGSRVGAA
jgi:dTDP-4-amino-4,6-dideoxygalactose transaminase